MRDVIVQMGALVRQHIVWVRNANDEAVDVGDDGREVFGDSVTTDKAFSVFDS